MKLNKIIKSKIKERLEQIYPERKKWSYRESLIDKSNIGKRESILFKQQILENLIIKDLWNLKI